MNKEIICELCDKPLSSKRNLKTHKEKTVPCDFQCRDCTFKGNNRHDYYKHRLSLHPEAKRITRKKQNVPENDADEFPLFKIEEPEEQKEPAEQTIIPLEDFRGGASNDFRGGEELIRHLIKIAKETTDKQVVFNIQYNVFNIYDKSGKIDPSRIAAEAFRACDYESALRCLETPNDTKQIAASVLSRMHSDPKRPQMHTIKMRKDLSRKQVDIYSRPSNDAPGEWLPYAYSAALHKLSEHAAALIYDALCGSISVFNFKFREKDRGLCVSLPTLIENKRIIVYNHYDDDDMALMPKDLDIILRVELHEGELYDVPKGDEEIAEQIKKLDKHIKSKGIEVIRLLKDIRFTDKDIGTFLERTRRPL